VVITEWIDTGATNVTTLGVNIQGGPFAETTTNQFYAYHWGGGVFNWESIPDLSLPNASRACMSSLAISRYTPNFAFPQTNNTNVKSVFGPLWGIDCQSSQLWTLPGPDTHWPTTRWTQVTNGDPASNLALFSSTGAGDIVQNPWVTMPNGRAYTWDSEGNTVRAGCPANNRKQIWAMTDHYVLAGNQLYRWTGDIYGHGVGTNSKDWLYVIDAPAGTSLNEVAYASSTGVVGPSSVWVLDSNGNVYRLDDVTIGDPK